METSGVLARFSLVFTLDAASSSAKWSATRSTTTNRTPRITTTIRSIRSPRMYGDPHLVVVDESGTTT